MGVPLQVEHRTGLAGSAPKYGNVFSALKIIVKEEGISALAKGKATTRAQERRERERKRINFVIIFVAAPSSIITIIIIIIHHHHHHRSCGAAVAGDTHFGADVRGLRADEAVEYKARGHRLFVCLHKRVVATL